jgi:hypothetical protein
MSWVDVTTAVGTAGAAVVALGLGLRGIYLDRRRQHDEELRQARLVMVSEPFFIDAGPGRGRAVAIKVYNFSDGPIHDITVGINIWRGGDAETPPDEREGVNWHFMAPKEEREVTFKVPQENSITAGSPELNFLDSSGRRFERSSTPAEPKRILHEPKPVIQVIDGEPILTFQRRESRFKGIIGKVLPRKSGNQ